MKAHPYNDAPQAPRSAADVAQAGSSCIPGLQPIANVGNPSNALERAHWVWFSATGPPDTWHGGFVLVRLVAEPYGAERMEYLGWISDEDGNWLAEQRGHWRGAW